MFVVLYIVIISINKEDVELEDISLIHWYRYLKTVENTKYDVTLHKNTKNTR